MPIRQFNRLNELRGLHPRTAMLLDRESAYRGTQYDHLQPWEPFYTLIGDCMCYIPKAQRAPAVQVGLVRKTVDALLRRVAGVGKFARLTVVNEDDELDDAIASPEGGTETVDALAQLTADLNAMKVRKSVILPLRDLALKGSGIIGFTAEPNGKGARLAYLPTEWCDAVLNSQVGGEKSKGYGTWLLNHVPGIESHVVSKPDKDGVVAYLKAAEGEPLDVAFVTYQWRNDEEVIGKSGDKTTRTTWHRRDYLRDVIIDYEPLVFDDAAAMLAEFKPTLPLRPHKWGVVPFAWMRPDGTPPGDLDGPAMITPQFMSVARAADYTATMRDTAYAYNAFPRLALVDAKLEGEFQANPKDGTNRDFAAGDPGAFLRIESRRQGTADVKVLETTGAAIDKGLAHGDRLRKDAVHLSGVQDIDEDENDGALSGTAVQRKQEPTVATVEAYRSTLEDGIDLVWWKLRRAIGSARDTQVSFLWPSPLTQTSDDAESWGRALVGAKAGGLVSHKTAVKKFAAVIGVEDAEAEFEAIQAEKAEAEARMLEQMKNSLPGPPPPGNDNGGGDGGGSDGGTG